MSFSSLRSMPARRKASPESRGRLLGGLFCLLIVGCAHRPPAEYARARAAAERAYSAGRYEDAANQWLTAAERAKSGRDATEARYRAAASWQRAGRDDRAAALYAGLAADPESDRAARAAFDQAGLLLDSGDRTAGLALIDDAIRRFPQSGVARRALERRLIDLHEEGGPNAALTYLATMEPTLASTELAETVIYQRARYQQLAGTKTAARDGYLTVAQRFPYPFGAYWDDALFHAAELDVELGNPRSAIAHLQRMLEQREPTRVHGSLERPRFGPARFLLAEIYRDELHDDRAARDSFLTLVDEHPTSLLRDDALWEAALLEREPERACTDLERLLREMPDSRYTPCAHQVCNRLPASTERCRDYIADSIPPSSHQRRGPQAH